MNYLIYKDSTSFDDALKMLDNNGNGFLPIVDEEQKLIGIITDGDIRRAVLNRQFDLEKVINRNPITASVNIPQVEIRKKLISIHRRHMPVIDENGRLVNVVILDDFETIQKDNWVVIMAGGIGSRLGDLTKKVPKPMLSMGGKPILHQIIEDFKSQGFHKFVLCVNYMSHVIENYFGNGDAFGVEIRYTKEEKKLGTAGALSLIDFEVKAPMIVTNGDLLVSINYSDLIDFHNVNRSQATMCVKLLNHEIPFACVEFDESNSLTKIKEKPSYDYYINAGIYVIDPSVVADLPYNEYFDMPSVFEMLLTKNQPIKIFTLNDYWLDIGRPEDFVKGVNRFNGEG